MKQAVLIIHGIGEQKPMETLRGFVTALVGKEYTSAPDLVDDTFELRKLSYFDEKGNKPNTDFYELYWAYRFRDSTFSQVLKWFVGLIQSENIPKRFYFIKTILVLICVFFFVVIFLLMLNFLWGPEKSGSANIFSTYSWETVALIAEFILSFASYYFIKKIAMTAGDASRYLSPGPENIQERQAIKKAGIQTIYYLHEKKDYDRILLVGHSLGSVIGYDILKHAWPKYNRKLVFDSHNTKDHFKRKAEYPYKFRDSQYLYWSSQIGLDKWKVSDFITLGSPLTYADFLLADNREEFTQRIIQREIPVCPPVKGNLELDDKDYLFQYGYLDGQKVILHHAAHFALTRWTNIFFEGDILGGELTSLFGKGIIDKKVELIKKYKAGRTKKIDGKISSHTKYWMNGDMLKNESVELLKHIIFKSGKGLNNERSM
ncbi:hypothetical protein [Echinicola shivajiensis]|uniref:hypothetical protein n=1 Tax=Echinicola shivajiensis TaxID=1035916 RepID=UPI001BFC1B94|nr:hypothetical protein [Echinicola shivajiensis]